MNKVKFSTDCFPVYGYNRCAIYDLTRNDFVLIPQSCFDFISEIEGKTHLEIKEIINENEIFEEYYDFLKEKEFIFECHEDVFSLFTTIDIDLEDYWDIHVLEVEYVNFSRFRLLIESLNQKLVNSVILNFNSKNDVDIFNILGACRT